MLSAIFHLFYALSKLESLRKNSTIQLYHIYMYRLNEKVRQGKNEKVRQFLLGWVKSFVM